MSRLPWIRLAVLLIGVLATAWWWSGQSDNEPSAPPAATSTPSPANPTPSAAKAPQPTPSVELDRVEAATAARTVLTTWARPHLDYDQWWDELQPLLTADGQETYEYTDPATIPALKVTGPATEDPAPLDPYVTTFWFQTSEGRFGVDVARAPHGGTWKAFSIIFPGNESRRQ